LSADYNSMDGLNPNMVNIDEMHAHKTRGTIDVLETATGARRQPLVNKITTAGDDPVSPCGDEHDYACKVLDGTLVDETYFAFIAHADEGDDWTLPETAAKANPNYGVSVNPDDLNGKVVKAISMPAAAATYKQKHLNLWVNATAPCLSVDGWRKGQKHVAIESLAHEPCFIGVDLASKIDLCALSVVFPPRAGRSRWCILQYIWTPEDTLVDRAHRDRAPYKVWVDQGWLKTTPGTRIDHAVVRETINELKNMYDIECVGFDPWHADKLIEELINDDGFTREQAIDVPQTYAGMSSACLRMQAEILAANVDVGGCPVTAWSVSNTVGQRDGKDNLMFTKGKSRGRIDPVIAMTIGAALYLRQPVEGPSVYEERGALVF
jgi:phage terminase large subunit-like protein